MRTFDYSFLERKLWTSNIFYIVSQIHEYKGRQEIFVRNETLKLQRLSKISKCQSTEFSNGLEGVVAKKTRLKALFRNTTTTPETAPEFQIMNYREILDTFFDKPETFQLKPTSLLQLHKNLLAKSHYAYAGRYRTPQDQYSEFGNEEDRFANYSLLDPAEIPLAVEKLFVAYEQATQKKTIDPLILIPIFVVDFLSIHPFKDSNARISRLLIQLLLSKAGYKIGKYFSLEKIFDIFKDRYYKALEESNKNWLDGKNDYTPFVKFLLQAIYKCYTEFENKSGLSDNSTNNCTAYDIVKKFVATQDKEFTTINVVTNCPKIGKTSSLNVINRLTEEGVIVRKGSGRSTYYLRADIAKKMCVMQ